jgi:hypothetical protein
MFGRQAQRSGSKSSEISDSVRLFSKSGPASDRRPMKKRD